MAPTAVLFDCLGTLLRLEPPGPRLRDELAALGYEITVEAAEGAIAAEIAYYLEHHIEGRDASSLAELRNRCAAVVVEHLDLPGLSVETARTALLDALRFEPYPDVTPALGELRQRGLMLVVASNWDASLRDVLARTGLEPLVDDVVTSAAVGATKPDRRVFEAAVRAAGRPPEETLHVGDSLENDVAGARAAGLRAVLLRRRDNVATTGDAPVIESLSELPALLL